MDLQVLHDELVNDPLVRGYSGMTDIVAAEDLNTVYRTQNVTSLTSTQVLQAVDSTAYSSLTDVQKQAFWGLLGMGALNPWGVEAEIFIQLFGAGSATIQALADLRTEDVSRAVELGLGPVTSGDVTAARAYGSV